MKSIVKILGAVVLAIFMAMPAQAATVTIQPTDTLSVGNCFPFGRGDLWDPYAGFVYQNVPAFELQVGDTLAFDLGATNDAAIQLDIAMATTTVNGGNVEDASGFITVVTNTQLPANPYGDTVQGNFELQFIAEAPFSFAGGGLIIRFSNPSAAYAADTNCNGVLVNATSSDASGNFVERFYTDADGVSPWSGAAPTIAIGGFQIVNNGLVLQPDGATGKDAYISSTTPDLNQGNSTQLVGNTPDVNHGLIEFDLASIPANSTINNASLEMLESVNCTMNENALEVHANNAAWTESTVTWNNAPAYGASLATNTGEAGACEWLKFDVAATVQDWVNGTSPNYGFRITGPAGGNVIKSIRSSDHTVAAERPLLRIDFTPPAQALLSSSGCGQMIPTDSKALWMVPILLLLLLGIGLVRRRA